MPACAVARIRVVSTYTLDADHKACLQGSLPQLYPTFKLATPNQFAWEQTHYGTYGADVVRARASEFKGVLVVYLGRNMVPQEARDVVNAGGYALFADWNNDGSRAKTLVLGLESWRCYAKWQKTDTERWQLVGDKASIYGFFPTVELVPPPSRAA